MPRPAAVVLAASLLAALPPAARAEPPLLEVSNKGAVYVVAWSPDGRLLASAGQDGTVILTALATGKEALRFRARGAVKGLAFAPDGKSLALKGDGESFSLYDAATGKLLKTLGNALLMYAGPHLAFSADGKAVIAVGVGERLIWQHTQGGAGGSKMGSPPAGGYAAVAPDGSRTAWGEPTGRVQLSDPNGLNFQVLQIGPAHSIAFAPDGKHLASGNADKVVRLWDIGGGREVRRFEGLEEVPYRLAFSANGKELAALASGGRAVRIWDVERGRARRQLTSLRAPVTGLALAPDGKTLATAGDDGKVRLWNLAVRDVARPAKPAALTAQELVALWEDLGSTDHARADAAYRGLASAGENALPFLRERLRRVVMPQVDADRVEKLLRDLDARTFAARDRAFAELAKYGELVEPRLRRLLAGKPSAEAARRVNQLLARLREPGLSPDRARALETVELLEWLRTPEARRVLEEVARDGLLRQLRAEAADALRRLDARDSAAAEKTGP
jgi:hypothetical protein